MLSHNRPRKALCCRATMRAKHRIHSESKPEERLASPGFVWTGLGALGDSSFPQLHRNNLKQTISLYNGRGWKAIAKMTPLWKLLRGGVDEQLPLLSAGLRAQNTTFFCFFLKRTMIISELRGWSGCGCLPSAASYKERGVPPPPPNPTIPPNHHHIWKLQTTSKTK